MAQRMCPVWIGYLLVSPLRKLFENPQKILSPYIQKGMKVLDIGCAMGFFSLPLAEMAGKDGKVICVDMQEKMLTSLKKRAKKSGLSNRIETRICGKNSLGLSDMKKEIDFALASAVAHEVTDPSLFFSEIFGSLKEDGKFLVAEPKGHISEKNFQESLSTALKNGFKVIERLQTPRSRAVLLGKSKPGLEE